MPATQPDSAVTAGEWSAAPCGLLLLDARDRVIAANARFLRRTGFETGDVVGRMFCRSVARVA